MGALTNGDGNGNGSVKVDSKASVLGSYAMCYKCGLEVAVFLEIKPPEHLQFRASFETLVQDILDKLNVVCKEHLDKATGIWR